MGLRWWCYTGIWVGILTWAHGDGYCAGVYCSRVLCFFVSLFLCSFVLLFLCSFVLLFNFLESLPTYCHDWPRGCHMEAAHENSCSLCRGVPIGSIMYIRGWPISKNLFCVPSIRAHGALGIQIANPDGCGKGTNKRMHGTLPLAFRRQDT